MASTPAVGETWKATFAATFNGQVAYNNVHYYVNTVAGTGVTDAAWVIDIATLMNPLYILALNNNATAVGVKLVRIVPQAVAIPVVSTLGTGVGTGGATALPTAICGLIQWKTLTISRSGRGRIYVPFPSSTALTAATSEPTAAYQTLLANIANGWLTNNVIGGGGNSITVSQVVWSHPKGKPATAYQITSALATPTWATQHRRGDYGRLNGGNPLPV